jgi:uncharacterized Fe-S cluster protein YjdI
METPKELTKHYSNADVTIIWKPGMCAHSGICFRGLKQVFDPRRKPWIVPGAATTDQIVGQIKKCPSGALSYQTNTI